MLYTGKKLKNIRFPLGGIGTGCISLAGNGGLTDFEIYNRPNRGGRPGYTFFALRAEYPDGHHIAKVLQGDYTEDLTGFDGCGADRKTMCGFPHFASVTFDGQFPIAKITFRDPDFPAQVELTAFNPFIPLDSENSSLPAAFFDLRISSLEDGIRYTAVFAAQTPFRATRNAAAEGLCGVTLCHAGKDPSEKEYGDVTVALDSDGSFLQEYWYRGSGWQDPVTMFWYELNKGSFTARHYDMAWKNDVGTIGFHRQLNAGQEASGRFVYAWNVPNNYNYWDPWVDEVGKDILWKNYYATRFRDSAETARYALNNWDTLFEKTCLFREALHGSTLDPAVTDAAASTLSVLKSPTVLRLSDGTFYGWEGTFGNMGSCEGTCTHVWSYAYALCFLFPDLERSIQETKFRYDTDENGKMSFRTRLPLGRGRSDFRACLDGQMASVFKSYRQWKISGDTQWLRQWWPVIKRLLEYAWSDKNPDNWDADRDGILEGRQHHTLDWELFGPSSWLEGMYLAALSAGAEMAEAMGEPETAAGYRELFRKGKAFTKEQLFNGSHFIQKVDLSCDGYIRQYNCPEYWNEEQQQLKYQIGQGSEIDQMLAQWHAGLCGLSEIYDREQRQTALKTMLDSNFKTMDSFVNAWRVFAIGKEQGTIMCDYPAGTERPVIPIPYADECMTGFEYAFAGLLIQSGMIEEGLKVVRAIRDRYDGEKRNPFNEIECGSNYARAMASFALLPIFSGFEYHMAQGHIGFKPVLPGDFRCLWSLAPAWGEFLREGNTDSILIHSGCLTLSSVALDRAAAVTALYADGSPVPFTENGGVLRFRPVAVRKQLRFEVAP